MKFTRRILVACCILIALSQAAAAWGQLAPIRPLSRAGGDAVLSLGCKRGDPGKTNNAAIITAALVNPAIKYGIHFPAGDFLITEPIVMSGAAPKYQGSGYSLTGEGTTKDGIDSNYMIAAGAHKCTRLVADFRGDMTIPLIRANAAHFRIENLQFVGGWTPDPQAYDNSFRAGIGLHINTSNGPHSDPGNINSAKCHLNNLAFHRIKHGLLIGSGLAEADGNGNFRGASDNHADTIHAGTLHFYYPFITDDTTPEGYAVWIRNAQSVSNFIDMVTTHGSPRAAVYIERGGRTHIGQISVSGPHATALRVGKIDRNNSIVTVGQICIDHAGATSNKLVVMDRTPTAQNDNSVRQVRIMSGHIGWNVTDMPIVEAASGLLTIENTNYFRAGSITMAGNDKPTYQSPRMCRVHLHGCTFYDCDWPTDAIASAVGPCIFSWSNCSAFDDGTFANRPFADGWKAYNGATRIEADPSP